MENNRTCAAASRRPAEASAHSRTRRNNMLDFCCPSFERVVSGIPLIQHPSEGVFVYMAGVTACSMSGHGSGSLLRCWRGCWKRAPRAGQRAGGTNQWHYFHPHCRQGRMRRKGKKGWWSGGRPRGQPCPGKTIERMMETWEGIGIYGAGGNSCFALELVLLPSPPSTLSDDLVQ